MKKRIKELRIEHRIAHVGWVDGEQKREFMKNTILNVLPSYNEGLPMTILETMAYGIPNISTRIASIPEVITDSENGYLITPGDIEALESRLLTLIEDKMKREQFSQKSYLLIKTNLSLPYAIDSLTEIYSGLI